ncbi:energy transducer TonB [Paracidobacterium acidisoli]|nr:energy transducer TonB [Paracidobacterium acidisoli]MBT9329606.1 TonB family protein [Paracidobacterium acidisoli]
MATNEAFDRGTFGLLPEEKGRMRSLGASTAINATIAALVLLLTASGVHQVQVKRYDTTQLIFPVEQPKPYVPPVPKVKVIPPPPVEKPRRIELPKPVPEPPKIAEIKVPVPAMPKIEAAPPRRVTPPPQPKVGLFKSETPTPVANNRAEPSLKTGGFGDPVGVKPNPNATRPSQLATVGSFNGSPGAGQPAAGSARGGSVHGVDFGSGVANGVPGGKDRGAVASAGFGSGVVGGTGRPGSGGTVARGSFGSPAYGPATPVAVRPQEPAATSIVVLSKPLPNYTPEARQLKIQGDVTLEVRFTAAGQVEVLRVISGLGHGLDEQARVAAEHIRFKPATRDGHAVDQVSVVHITFQMA